MKNRKPGIAFLILFLLTIVFAAVISIVTVSSIVKRDNKRNSLKIDSVQTTLDVLVQEYLTEYENYMAKSNGVGDLTAMMLAGYMRDGVYYGPETLKDGYVVQLSGDKLYYPEKITYYPDFTMDLFTEEQQIIKMAMPDDEIGMRDYIVTVNPIAGDYFYIDMSPTDEIVNAVLNNVRYIQTIDDIESSYGCRLYFISMPFSNTNTSDNDAAENPIEFLLTPSDKTFSDKTPEELGFTKKVILEHPTTVTIAGKQYLATYKEIEYFGDPCMVIILNNFDNYTFTTVTNVVLFSLIVLIAGTSLILWIHWVQKYLREKELDSAQAAAYRPSEVRKRAAAVAVIGAVSIFLFGIFYQTLSNLNREAISNHDALATLARRLEQKTTDESARQVLAESWAEYNIERVAVLMQDNPEFYTEESLKKINDMIGSDYLILFDAAGRELASSNGIIGYSITETDFLKKFQDLLNGIGIITGTLETDPITLTNNMKLFGIPVFFSEEESYGALILAVNEEDTWQRDDNRSLQNYLENSTPEGNLCVVIEKEKNKVVYSSNPELINTVIPGIEHDENDPDSSDLDTYMVNNTRYYGSYESYNDNVIYYLAEETLVRGNSYLFALVAAATYFVVILVVSWYMLSPYTQEQYQQMVHIKENEHHDDLTESDSWDAVILKQKNQEPEDLKTQWRTLDPGQRIRLCLQIFFGILLIIFIILFFTTRSGNLQQFNTHSTINFILFGNWKHGFNLLGLAAVLIIIFAFVIFIFFKNIMLRILCDILDQKGETICRLTFSLFQYGAVIGMIYLILGFLGVNTTFQLTSVGIVSLAISLGSKNIVADILAGILIIFEGDYQVGDFVDINGFTGIVQEIGVRSTKVLGLGDNVKIIGNQNITNVLNMSKMNTWLTITIPLPPSMLLADFEALIKENLPGIGANIPEIISGPYYKGVWAVSDFGKKIIHISCECKEQHSRIVQRKLMTGIVKIIEENNHRLG